MNETAKIKKTTDKKELLLNRKKKRVLNDTALGRLLQYGQDNVQTYRSNKST